MRRRRSRAGTAAVAAVVFLLVATAASAELTERGNLFVKFEGGIAPTALPRHERAPIAVRVAGTVKTLSGERPPALRRIRIAINRGGSIDTKGLPRCRRDQIEATTTARARRVCGRALVGGGRYLGVVVLPDQPSYVIGGRVLAFNSIVNGRRAILLHVYDHEPAPSARVIVFRVRQAKGTYGTVLVGDLPPWINRHGYVKEISLNLYRTYSHRGRKRSYLGAHCNAPAGFPGAVFAFARTSMTFADGRELASVLVRSCQVRD